MLQEAQEILSSIWSLTICTRINWAASKTCWREDNLIPVASGNGRAVLQTRQRGKLHPVSIWKWYVTQVEWLIWYFGRVVAWCTRRCLVGSRAIAQTAGPWTKNLSLNDDVILCRWCNRARKLESLCWSEKLLPPNSLGLSRSEFHYSWSRISLLP